MPDDSARSTDVSGDFSEKPAGKVEIGHILFIDIVGYSKLLTNVQRECIAELNRVVRASDAFRAAEAAGKLIKLPTGDGMVLAFFTSPDAPVRCAIDISKALRGRDDLPLRIGIHSGPVEQITDVTDRANLAGAGVNIAQRVMDCGDAGHILLSARAADDLAQHAEWNARIHDLGEVEVKHGVRVRVASLYDDDVGNATLPGKVVRAVAAKRRRNLGVAAATLALVAICAGIWWMQRQRVAARNKAAAEAAVQREKSVAVLPFENLTTDDKDAVFAGGVHREVLSNLAKVADIKVVSRTSVMKYKPGVERNLKQIANDLGVNYVVEGAVQRDATRVHVTVELVDARTDRQAWSETYDGNVADVLSFQVDIAQRVTNELGAKLSAREVNELVAQPTKDYAAFEAYVRAKTLAENAHDDDGPEHVTFVRTQHEVLTLLAQAVARDSNFALAHGAIAEANIQLYREAAAAEYGAAAEAALKTTERLAPEAGETLYERARFIYYVDNDFHGALAMLERAAKLLPNNANIYYTRGLLYRRFGRWQEAYEQFRRAAELNPNDLEYLGTVPFTATGLRWWDEAERARARIAAKYPHAKEDVNMMRMVTLRLSGDVEAGNKLMDELHLTVKDGFAPLFYRALWNRDYAECRRLLDEAKKFPEYRDDQFQKEAILAFVTHDFRARADAIAAEPRFDEEVSRSHANSSPRARSAWIGVKYLVGKANEAVKIIQQTVATHPISEDALANYGYVEDLAFAYLLAGDHDGAIATLRTLVKTPSLSYGYGRLKNDPIFDPLRNDPRFAAILEESRTPFPRVATNGG